MMTTATAAMIMLFLDMAGSPKELEVTVPQMQKPSAPCLQRKREAACSTAASLMPWWFQM